METRVGPAWSELGLTYAAPRYPLRVETHLLRLVSRLLSGIITTTTQARMYALHAVAWSEAKAREYELDEALDLVRRCEVVVAAATMAHDPHLTRVPLPHGYATVGPYVDSGKPIPVGEVSKPGAYAQYQWGFAGTYQGSEVALGILEDGRPPGPGKRADEAALRDGFAGLFELADSVLLSIDDVRAASHLCMCSAPEHADGPWLRKVLFEGADDWTDVDESRRASARLLLRVVRDLSESDDVPRDFRHAIGFGAAPEGDGLERTVAEGWRGAVLRNYSVGAWRRLWSWLVEQMVEPVTVPDLAELFAAELPAGMTIADMVDALPAMESGGELLTAEEDLREEDWRHPWVELRLLAVGAHRVDHLEGAALTAFAGPSSLDDLGPRWFARRLYENSDDTLEHLARELTELMVRRAHRVSLSKMQMRPEGFWIPTRVREREGLLFRTGEEGASDVALRTDTLRDVLCGVGALHRDAAGVCTVTGYGESLLG